MKMSKNKHYPQRDKRTHMKLEQDLNLREHSEKMGAVGWKSS